MKFKIYFKGKRDIVEVSLSWKKNRRETIKVKMIAKANILFRILSNFSIHVYFAFDVYEGH